MYQYPARLVSNAMKTKSKKNTQAVIPVQLTWEEHEETEIRIDISAKNLIETLGRKYGFDASYCQLCCIKTIGEASFLLGDDHTLSDYAFIQENPVPRLVILAWDSIDIYDVIDDAVYSCLEKDVLVKDDLGSPSESSSPKILAKSASWTNMSLTNLVASTYISTTLYSR